MYMNVYVYINDMKYSPLRYIYLQSLFLAIKHLIKQNGGISTGQTAE